MSKQTTRYTEVPLSDLRDNVVRMLTEKQSITDYLSWKDLHALTVDEMNPDRLRILVNGVETAVFVRSQQLTDAPEDRAEKEAIRQVCDELIRIRTERLGWPLLAIDTATA